MSSAGGVRQYLAARLSALLRTLARQDPLARAWLVLSSPQAMTACLGLLLAIIASAAALPGLYADRHDLANSLGYEQAPYSLLLTAALSAATVRPWGRAVLALSALVGLASAARNAAAIQADPIGPSGPTAPPVLLYAERSLGRVLLRLRLVVAMFGYRLRWPASGQNQAIAEAMSARFLLRCSASLGLTLVCLLALRWPASTSSETIVLQPGQVWPLKVQAGSTLSSDDDATSRGLLLHLSGRAPIRIHLQGVFPAWFGSLFLSAHGDGPALIITAPAGGQTGAGSRTVVCFSPGEAEKYVTLLQRHVALRIVLVGNGFRVEELPAQGGQPTRLAEVSTAASVDVGGTALTFLPSRYVIVSAWHAPLLLPILAVLLISSCTGLLSLFPPRPPMRLSFARVGPVLTIQVDTVQGHAPGRPLRWLLRLALR